MKLKVTKQHIAIKLSRREWEALRQLVNIGVDDLAETLLPAYKTDRKFGEELLELDTSYVPEAATHFRTVKKRLT